MAEPGNWFNARYEGTCSRCDIQFDPPAAIRADGQGGYECCEEGDDELGVSVEEIRDGDGNLIRRERYVLCEKCCLVKPCWCEESK